MANCRGRGSDIVFRHPVHLYTPYRRYLSLSPLLDVVCRCWAFTEPLVSGDHNDTESKLSAVV